jgi:hypothetical protein
MFPTRLKQTTFAIAWCISAEQEGPMLGYRLLEAELPRHHLPERSFRSMLSDPMRPSSIPVQESAGAYHLKEVLAKSCWCKRQHPCASLVALQEEDPDAALVMQLRRPLRCMCIGSSPCDDLTLRITIALEANP